MREFTDFYKQMNEWIDDDKSVQELIEHLMLSNKKERAKHILEIILREKRKKNDNNAKTQEKPI